MYEHENRILNLIWESNAGLQAQKCGQLLTRINNQRNDVFKTRQVRSVWVQMIILSIEKGFHLFLGLPRWRRVCCFHLRNRLYALLGDTLPMLLLPRVWPYCLVTTSFSETLRRFWIKWKNKLYVSNVSVHTSLASNHLFEPSHEEEEAGSVSGPERKGTVLCHHLFMDVLVLPQLTAWTTTLNTRGRLKFLHVGLEQTETDTQVSNTRDGNLHKTEAWQTDRQQSWQLL